MTKEELRKSLDFVNEEIERLQRENEDLRSAIANYQEAVGDCQDELIRNDNIINNTIETIKELIDDSEDTTCYEITNTVKRLLLEELEKGE